MKFVITLVILGIGFAAGTFIERGLNHCDCPNEDSHVALEGCEVVAADLSEELNECRWDYGNCQHKFNECATKYEELYNIILNIREK